MTILRAIIGLLGLAVGAAIIWAWFFSGTGDLHPDFAETLSIMIAIPWGVVTLMDFALLFLMFGVLVFLVERNPLIATLWCIPIPILGGFWIAIWFALRLPTLASRLSRPDFPSS